LRVERHVADRREIEELREPVARGLEGLLGVDQLTLLLLELFLMDRELLDRLRSSESPSSFRCRSCTIAIS